MATCATLPYLVPRGPGSALLRDATLTAPVELKFDSAGVAHVFASTLPDAAFGIGVAHARQRRRQLELSLRLYQGRLSELAGRAMIERDSLMRRLRLAEVAREQFARLPSDEQQVLTSYARGIHAVAPSLGWEAADCIGWSLFLAFQMSGNWVSELDRWNALRTMDRDQVMLLLPGTGDANISADAMAAPQINASPLAVRAPAVPTSAAALGPRDATGSNSWAVPGNRSATGLPLLANDPHLPLTHPSPWFLARIAVRSDDPAQRQDVIGATSPGLPMVLIGRTHSVAWGLTRNGADTQDLYIEQVAAADNRRYRTETGLAMFTRRSELIQVRGASAVTIDTEASRHGPIVAELQASHADASDEARQRVALRWTAFRSHEGSISAALRANRAHDCASLMQAFRSHVAPVQNVVGADADGKVCFGVAGQIPLRDQQHAGGGLWPVTGWNTPDWQGSRNPGQMAGLDGKPIANANQALQQAGPDGMAGEWDMPQRHQRILDLLAARPLHDVQSFQAMQYDTQSYEATRLLPLLLRQARAQASEMQQSTGGQAVAVLAQAAREQIASFEGNMRADSAAALIYAAWVDELTRQMIGRHIGSTQFGVLYGRRNFRPALHRILTDPQEALRWCDSAHCGREIAESLARAVEKIARTQGQDVRRWSWGQAHAPEGSPLALPMAGDSWTINMTHYEPAGQRAAYPARIVANLRLVHDLSGRNKSWFVQLGGPDEVPSSAINRHFALDWQQGRYRELSFDPPRWQQVFTLQPQR